MAKLIFSGLLVILTSVVKASVLFAGKKENKNINKYIFMILVEFDHKIKKDMLPFKKKLEKICYL